VGGQLASPKNKTEHDRWRIESGGVDARSAPGGLERGQKGSQRGEVRVEELLWAGGLAASGLL
jgi:hypothetical protein